jgi:hypothetical protein
MASTYKITAEGSTLGPQGGTVTDADLEAASVDAALLIASNIIAPITPTKSTTLEKD